MAEAATAPSFGVELKDAFKSVNSWVANGINWLDDIQQFYRDRSAIEKEYSAKLNSLAKKYHEKKAKKSCSLSVGDTPAMTPGSLENASLTTWTTQLTTVESRAAQHDRYSSELITQLADPLKVLGTRFEDLRKRHAEYAGKLEIERDSVFGDLRKVKSKYDASCLEVESKRKKAESSFDYSKVKSQNAYQQQILEMHNSKNSYLIAISVTNAQKQKYYHEYVPELLDSLQDLSESRTLKLNEIWLLATQIENAMLERSRELINNLAQEIPRNQPRLDSTMFIKHNIIPWQEPPDKTFEPSPIWHDDDLMVVDDVATVFLRNVLAKSKAQLGDLRREVDKKRQEVNSTKRIKEQVREGRDKRDEVELVRSIFAQQEELHVVDRKRLTAEIETSTITTAVGDVTLGARSHNFKSQTFKIPTNCDLCGERIWGLSAKGFDCRDCGYTCHSKCEMKVPAECPGEQSKEQKKKLKTERQEAANSLSVNFSRPSTDVPTEKSRNSRTNTMNSQNSSYAVSLHRSMSGTKPPPEDQTSERTSPTRTMSSVSKVLQKNRVLAAPPPSMYTSELTRTSTLNNGHRSLRSSEQKGKMLYPYDANGEGEVTVVEGDEVEILEADDAGWINVRTPSGECGLVPTAYVEIFMPRPAVPNLGMSPTSQKKQGPAVAPKRGAKKLKFVEALYAYTAQSDAELSMIEGERFVLVKGDPGDGWTEVEKGGKIGNVPANYLRNITDGKT
ncbi:hypothetical protein K3495_g7438 [Podosphaera aphanis]|nr:hypothetical protein K3495_g7438 [Podosphaera aphanis]